jgi:hypothetical protein
LSPHSLPFHPALQLSPSSNASTTSSIHQFDPSITIQSPHSSITNSTQPLSSTLLYPSTLSPTQPHSGTGTIFSIDDTTNSSPSLHPPSNTRRKALLNLIKGDIHLTKNPNVFRFLYQNINGLRLNTFDKWRAIVIRMLNLQCNLVGLNEPCANWKLNKLKQKCQQILRTAFKNSSILASTVPITSNTNYLPGGTATISLGIWNSRILHPLYDPTNMGRWTGASYCHYCIPGMSQYAKNQYILICILPTGAYDETKRIS